jgi:hypothetical protein
MTSSLVADLIVTIHLGYVIFVVFGLFIILLGRVLRWHFIRNFWFRAIHLTMILIVVFQAVFGISCPLTIWEYEIRTAAGQPEATNVSFVVRLIHRLIFYEFPPIVFTIGYCLFGIIVLSSWLLITPLLPWKEERKKKNEEEVVIKECWLR